MNEFKQWFLDQSPRDQMMLSVGGAAVLLYILIFMVLLPLQGDLERNERRNQAVLQEQEEVRSWQRMSRLAPALALVFGVVMSFLSFDFAMSLDPHWFSTLFGGWFFMGSFWGGIAAIAFTSTSRRSAIN